MPVISRFFGISIRIYYADHVPAHFHARYGEFEALVSIVDLCILEGQLPRRAMAMVLEWAALHREELKEDWELARSRRPLRPISPLE